MRLWGLCSALTLQLPICPAGPRTEGLENRAAEPTRMVLKRIIVPLVAVSAKHASSASRRRPDGPVMLLAKFAVA
jgi:hypothetical protein